MKVVIEWLTPEEGGRLHPPFDLTRYTCLASFPRRDVDDDILILENVLHDGPGLKSLGEVVEEFSEVPPEYLKAGQKFELHECGGMVARAHFVEKAHFVPRALPPPPPKPLPKAAPRSDDVMDMIEAIEAAPLKAAPSDLSAVDAIIAGINKRLGKS